MLDFREHFLHITKDVKKLAKTLAKRNLSPPLKSIAIDELLKSKYNATHLGVFNERQLRTIDGILNKTMRQALCLLPNFLSEGVERPVKEAGLGLSPMRDRATQMGIEHLTRVMNKDKERGFTVHAHVHRLLFQFDHWPQEALDYNPLKLPCSASLDTQVTYPGWNVIACHHSTQTMISPLASERHHWRSTMVAKKSVPRYKGK